MNLNLHHLLSPSPKILRTIAFRRAISNSATEPRARSSLNREMCKVEVDHGRSENLIKFLVKHDSLAVSHQNQAATSCVFTGMPESWVDWCKQGSNSWRDIMRLYQSKASDSESKNLDTTMPPDLVAFIQQCVSLPIPRRPFFVPEGGAAPKHVNRVNPKKIHEVFTMSSYVSSLFKSDTSKPRIVDIGAGQGYLSRALSSSPHNFHVLAVDSSESQVEGSISRKDWLPAKSTTNEADEEAGTLTHKTTRIGDTESLSGLIEGWTTNPVIRNPTGLRVPVILVGLHCCGDLTPSILRFLDHSIHHPHPQFDIIGCMIVGCCYNMCEPTTFPISQKVSAEITIHGPLNLQTQHLHLATQSPLTWSLPSSSSPNQNSDPYSAINTIALSIRKVTYRALLARRLPSTHRAETDTPLTRTDLVDVDWRTNRVGRLGNGAYKDFPTFLGAAKGKLGINDGCGLDSDLTAEERELSRILEVFYVLRCLLGPVIESIVALDRYAFLQEVMKCGSPESAHGGMEDRGTVELINLFDQFTGSLRNLALVWTKGS